VTLWDASDRPHDQASELTADALRWARAWHEKEAADSKRNKNHFGEVFHLSQLIALEPNNPAGYQRRGDAYTAWSRSDTSGPAHVVSALADYQRALQLRGSRLLMSEGGN
jgi:hypothetical protein